MTFSVTQLGQANGAGDTQALFLKLFTGEVYEAFRNATIAKGLVMNRTLKNGKEAQFIHTGRVNAGYHTPGNAILGSGDPNVAETTIAMDDLLVASAFVDNLDEVLAQYDIRGPIARQIGQSLAEYYDRRIFRVLDQASADTAPVSGEPGGFPGGAGFVGGGVGLQHRDPRAQQRQHRECDADPAPDLAPGQGNGPKGSAGTTLGLEPFEIAGTRLPVEEGVVERITGHPVMVAEAGGLARAPASFFLLSTIMWHVR